MARAIKESKTNHCSKCLTTTIESTPSTSPWNSTADRPEVLIRLLLLIYCVLFLPLYEGVCAVTSFFNVN